MVKIIEILSTLLFSCSFSYHIAQRVVTAITISLQIYPASYLFESSSIISIFMQIIHLCFGFPLFLTSSTSLKLHSNSIIVIFLLFTLWYHCNVPIFISFVFSPVPSLSKIFLCYLHCPLHHSHFYPFKFFCQSYTWRAWPIHKVNLVLLLPY